MKKPRYIDLTGIKYNKLTVVSPSTRKNLTGSIYWNCICECGNTHQALGAQLKNNTVTSCGCVGKLKRAESLRLPDGEASFNALYSGYSRAAKKRGYSFDLTKGEFRTLVKHDCTYCGCKPSQFSKKSIFPYGDFLYNGVDRRDNSKGYTKENSVPCCGLCNKMKGVLSVEEFNKHILSIYSLSVKNWLEEKL